MEEGWTDAILGGALIGSAAVILLVFNGRILGVSGILGGLFRRGIVDRSSCFSEPVRKEGIAFLLGLLITGFFYQRKYPDIFMIEDAPIAKMLIAGFLVGFGTSMGGGCTSGHGICGIGRFSPRSVVATLVFMGVAMGVVYII